MCRTIAPAPSQRGFWKITGLAGFPKCKCAVLYMGCPYTIYFWEWNEEHSGEIRSYQGIQSLYRLRWKKKIKHTCSPLQLRKCYADASSDNPVWTGAHYSSLSQALNNIFCNIQGWEYSISRPPVSSKGRRLMLHREECALIKMWFFFCGFRY